MPSPFPGMNPYLEQESVWHGFHQHFTSHLADSLVPQVRPKYIVRIDEFTYIHELPADDRRMVGRPDAAVVDRGTAGRTTGATGLIDAPAYVEVPMAVDVENLSSVSIVDRESRHVVTAIELLGPSNKRPGADRDQYHRKRLNYLKADTHFVELDLLRGGPRLPVERLPPCDYYALVSRAGQRPRAGVWPIGLRDRLPEIPIPLSAPDDDVRLDLQQLLNRVYDSGSYEDYVYDGLPQPPLPADYAAWARQLVGR